MSYRIIYDPHAKPTDLYTPIEDSIHKLSRSVKLVFFFVDSPSTPLLIQKYYHEYINDL